MVHERARIDEARGILTAIGVGEATIDEHTRKLTVPALGGAQTLAIVIRDLDEAGIAIDDIALRRPTLDDVFLSLTGHRTVEEQADDAEALGRTA